VKNHIVVLFWH